MKTLSVFSQELFHSNLTKESESLGVFLMTYLSFWSKSKHILESPEQWKRNKEA